jgi:hypothetical protein
VIPFDNIFLIYLIPEFGGGVNVDLSPLCALAGTQNSPALFIFHVLPVFDSGLFQVTIASLAEKVISYPLICRSEPMSQL